MLSFADFFDEKKCYVATLLKLAKSDSNFKLVENMWLNFVTISMGISPNELEEIFNNLEKFSFMAPQDESERFFMFFRLIQLMKVDLNIDDQELAFCRDLGLRLSILPTKVDKALKFASENEKDLISYEDVLTILK